MQIPGWFLVTMVCRLVLAMLPVGFLPCTKKSQVGIFSLVIIQEFEFVHRFVISFVFDLADMVRKEAATITAVFPSPNEVMSILVQVLGRKFSLFAHCFKLIS